MEKDMKTVNEFENKRQINILRSECFNNASVLLAGKDMPVELMPEAVFLLARKLFDAAASAGFLNWAANSAVGTNKKEK